MKSHSIIGSLFVLILMVFVFNFVSIAHADDWPNFRGPNYNGVSNETDLSFDWSFDDPDILWKADIGTGFSSIAVCDGKTYAMGNTGTPPIGEGEEGINWATLPPDGNFDIVYCFDASTGKEIWQHKYAAPLVPNGYEGGPNATPAVDSDRVYTLSKNGMFFCLNAKTGKQIWQKNLIKECDIKIAEWGLSGSPLIIDDMVIVNAAEKGIAFNKYNGKIIWKNGTGPTGYATPVPNTFKGKKCIALFGHRYMYGLDPFTGKQLWSVPWETMHDQNNPNPIISDDKIFISTGAGKGCGVFEFKGDKVEQVWRNKNMRNHFNSCVLQGQYVYGFDEKTLKCLDFTNGNEQWEQKGLGKGSLMIADGKLIILSEKGKLVIAEASEKNFKEISSAQIMSTKRSWTVPVLANGKIYARNSIGELVCINVRAKIASEKLELIKGE
ncbi:MAG: PQQ-binding-like beta-propeller repeat protein [Planctomycetota bacterium]